VNAKDRRVQLKHRKKKAKLRARRKEQAAAGGAPRPPARHA
jgi:hypothetical protein